MYVLLFRYNGIGAKPSADIERIARMDGVDVVNTQLPKSIVVHVRGDYEVSRLTKFPNWSLSAPLTTEIDTAIDSLAAAKNGFSVSKYLRRV